jgi:hypothetical protein
MAWTAPITWTASHVVTAAELNTGVRDNLNFLHTFSGVYGYKAADQTLTTAVEAAMVMDTESYDTDAYHDNATTNTRFTIPTGFDGYYLLGAMVDFAGNATGVRRLSLRLNGATELALAQVSAAGATVTRMGTVSLITHLAAADYVEATVFQNSGGNLAAVAGLSTTHFWMMRLGI